MKFGILDPRKTQEAEKNNSSLLGEKTLGIEVTIPELAARCGLGNIDPQHSDKKQQAAIEYYLQNDPSVPIGTTLVTIRADLDSIGVMALIAMRYTFNEWILGKPLDLPKDIKERLAVVVKSDSFQNGVWQPYPLPTKKNSWPAKNASASDIRELAAMAMAVADFKVAIETRVEWMSQWIMTGQEPDGYRERVETERLEMIEALETGKIKLNLYEGNMIPSISVVESTYRAATMIGYSKSPIVVAINPEFKFQSDEPYRKVTIAQFSNDYVNLKAVIDRLNMDEPGWGGSLTICGSPQGKSTSIPVENIVRAIQENVL